MDIKNMQTQKKILLVFNFFKRETIFIKLK